MAVNQEEADIVDQAFIEAFDPSLTEEQQAERSFKAWNMLYALMERENNFSERLGIESIDWQIGNWANDTTMALHNAKRYEDCIRVNEQILKIDWGDNETSHLFHENALRDIADEYSDMGEKEKALGLYEQYLEDDPLWGWGWIGYYRVLHDHKDPRFEKVLYELYEKIKTGIPLRDTEDLYRELGDEFQFLGDEEKANYCHDLAKKEWDKKYGTRKSNLDLANCLNFHDKSEATPMIPKKKIYPNDPCPCGSGKKYKKCCGKNK